VRSWKSDLESIAAVTTIIGFSSVYEILVEGVDQTEAPPTGVHHPIASREKQYVSLLFSCNKVKSENVLPARR
jgi:hypothetical protein